jgi:hypothetical protein
MNRWDASYKLAYACGTDLTHRALYCVEVIARKSCNSTKTGRTCTQRIQNLELRFPRNFDRLVCRS